jgi:hypothetical protein
MQRVADDDRKRNTDLSLANRSNAPDARNQLKLETALSSGYLGTRGNRALKNHPRQR